MTEFNGYKRLMRIAITIILNHHISIFGKISRITKGKHSRMFFAYHSSHHNTFYYGKKTILLFNEFICTLLFSHFETIFQQEIENCVVFSSFVMHIQKP
jgi:hypothetical protein